MVNDLTLQPAQVNAVSKYSTPEVLADVLTASDYIPYIQLVGASSNLAKAGNFQIGHFGLFRGKEPIDLGDSFTTVVLSWRPRAMEFGEDVISIFNPENPEFIRIKTAAQNNQQGYVFGPEYLMYLPDFDELAVYLYGNTSSQLEAPNVQAVLEKQNQVNEYQPITIYSELVENRKRQSWHVPCSKPSETPLEKMVNPDVLKPVLEKFNNPTDSEVETVESGEERPM